MDVAIGIDSHKATMFVAVVDPLGRTGAAQQFPNDDSGHSAALRWIQAQQGERVIGIEGSGFYGSALARTLLAAGEDVKEIPAFLTSRERRRTPSRGKSDPVDAVAIARVTARGEGLSDVKDVSVYDDLKLLSDRRDQLIRLSTETANRIHADLVRLHPGYQIDIPNLRSKSRVMKVAELVRDDRSVRAQLVRERVEELLDLRDRILATEAQMSELIERSQTTLTSLDGVGLVVAAKILGEIGGPQRLRSQASFAAYNGTAPLEASSGATKRHRLNRGGNRQLNFALHIMATARRRSHAETKVYLARLRSEGKTSREAMRCLKRHLSNAVYRTLVSDLQVADRAA